ncbi:hypothetical protein Rs2_28559 [Raphanus sativus]|nr:hypothetical protein Rs2_28559 [Raphanus sativus]
MEEKNIRQAVSDNVAYLMEARTSSRNPRVMDSNLHYFPNLALKLHPRRRQDDWSKLRQRHIFSSSDSFHKRKSRGLRSGPSSTISWRRFTRGKDLGYRNWGSKGIGARGRKAAWLVSMGEELLGGRIVKL